ncbi:phage tail domain-containing protein [Thermoactinomyces sp. DSM 45892]|uniref:phage tail domain-containing protein n=1 Tax=Thermoactinomyces sp. DSM 45892 TaxID=1882753 RepID=UPI00089C0B47|nr:phage tail domain-containing protein [Thermoactinomyces sp. DSM 45892]SDX95987.1 Phage-related protein [Thermoactinomyces sp. DSM 45892]
MPTTKDRLHFNYDGISSRKFGLIQVNLDSGMFEEALIAERAIQETEVRGQKPLFHSIEESPLEFDLTLAFERKFNESDLDNIILWLFPDTYKPLYFEDKPNKIYHCLPVGNSSITHNGLNQGYLTVTMRCDSPRIVSPLYYTPEVEVANEQKTSITIENKGHLTIYPEISIKKIGAGNITLMKDEKIFEIRDLTDQEDIYLHCEKEVIETDLIGFYRYDQIIGDFSTLSLQRGTNKIEIEGACKIQFRYRFLYKT